MSVKRAVVLLSGGLDSAVTLYKAKELGFECFCLAFDYGQRHRRELESARAVARMAGSALRVVKCSLPWKGSSLLDTGKEISRAPGVPAPREAKPSLPKGDQRPSKIPSTYVPARNIIFLSFALSYAEALGAEAIFIGAHAQDYSGYPDCRPEFYRAFRLAARKGTKTGVEGRPIEIVAPLLRKNKAQIIKLGIKLGAPLELTWSCYRGGRKPCGVCESCYFRNKGFEEAHA
jgi:7-cyano-7-deazaguanine synthase